MEKQLEKILRRVQKPGRYSGGEWNSICKDWKSIDVKMAFAFPDVYEVGMSHLGLQILYSMVNSRDDALMERVFAPWPDMEQQMRNNGLPLFSLESRRPLRDFNIIGFTLQYELSFTNIVNMLDLGGIPLHSAERMEGDYPLVVAGGPCAFNPEPIAEFIDVFAIGEGEELLTDLLDAYLASRRGGESRQDMLLRLAGIEGIYIPALYRVEYNSLGTINTVTPLSQGVPARVQKRAVTNVDAAVFPTRMVVPAIEAVHDRAMLEVQRGCTRGCRFCQAGIIYRPVREKEPDTLLHQASNLLGSTGWEEISLTSLSTSDFSQVTPLVHELINKHGSAGVNVSLPSLRVDAFSVDLAKEVQQVRRSSLTFAPEAGTQRLRDVINKGVTEDDLMAAVEAAFMAGWHSIKLYFMIGLPTETDEDLQGIANLARKVLERGRRLVRAKGRLKVTVSVSSFVPKSHTVFQWEPQNSIAELKRKQALLRELLRNRGLVFKWHDPEGSFLEAVLSRGDRRLAGAIEAAWRNGARFDGWSEFFDLSKWTRAFASSGIAPEWYAYKQYSYEDTLPWDHISTGVSKNFLVREHRRSLEGAITPDCRDGRCQGCGLCVTLEAKPYFAGGETVASLSNTVL
ncbi:Radical SAM superfamily protein [Sporotomaculum syntrophicum]|uniref:Radical SAM superfamily protein n=1 Tax=Sporotomaculum syntrophicum TaxID=182264 RepID=A0A9D3AYM9_9FIRM|nr:TIGR03960 family B12-binding radical SAM protein [Sporotomaculum syntrophicum]KAF1085616.1 Radical SAM superfamily protein [Sporotomaculum syntrophicum]